MIVRKMGDVTVVGMTERLDSATAPAAEAALRGVIDGADQALLLDFSATTYISSAGLRLVVQAARAMKAKKGRFAICSLQEFVREVFETAGLTSLVDLYESEGAARAGMGGRA